MKLISLTLLCLLSLNFNTSIVAEELINENLTDEYAQLLETKRYQEVVNRINLQLTETPNDARLYFFAAQAHMGLKNYKNSVENAAQAVLKDPKSSDNFRLLADAEVLKQLGAENTSILRLPGLARRTKRNYQTAIALDPMNIKAHEGLGLFYLLAPRIVGGSTRKAKAQADEIAKIDINKAMPFYIGIQKKYKRWDKALKLANEWQEKEPELWKPIEDKFRIYFEQNKYEQAAKILIDYLAKNPNEMNANYLLGLVTSDSGLYLEKGRDALLNYLKSDPDLNQPGHEWSYYRLAMIYSKLDKLDLAKETAKKAISQSPQNTKVAALVNEFLRNLS